MKNLKCTFIIAVVLATLAAGINGCGNKGGKLSSITITPTDPLIAKGTGLQFTATAFFSDGTTLDWSSVAQWSSSNESAVTVSNDFGSYGTATAVLTALTGSITTITITATDTPNNISGSAVLTVVDPADITIIPTNPYMAVNTSHQFRAEALLSIPTRSTTQDITSSLTWTTSNSTFATVGTPGLVTAGSTGEGFIEVTYSSLSSAFTRSTKLTVNPLPLKEIIITAPTLTMAPGGKTTFTAKGILTDDSLPFDFMPQSLIWSSSNPPVADVSNALGTEGLVTAGTTTGDATIIATDPISGIGGRAMLTVHEAGIK